MKTLKYINNDGAVGIYEPTAPLCLFKTVINAIRRAIVLSGVRRGITWSTSDNFDIYIAGGAIRDYVYCKHNNIDENKMIKDLDVFILPHSKVAESKLWKDFLSCLTSYDYRNLLIDRIEPFASNDMSKYHADFTIINNLKFTFAPYPTQIILRKGITKVNELFDEFDWSVCQIATDGEKVFATHKCIDNLEFKTPMKLTNEKGALRTLKRGFNLSHKLGLEVDHDDTIKLCEKLAKTKQQFKPIKKLDFGDDDI